MTNGHAHCPSCEAHPHHQWGKNPLFLVCLAYLGVFFLGYLFPIILPLKRSLISYLKTITLPMLIGLLLGGTIDWLIPREYVSKALAGKSKLTIIYAVLSGFLTSVCSHGILAIAIQLYKKGAAPPAVVAFLLASPWANLPLTILMFGFFGIKALYIIISALVIALITGYVFMVLQKFSLIEHNPHTVEVAESFSILKDARERLSKVKINLSSIKHGLLAILEGALSLANMVLWWIMLGTLLASTAAAYIPPNFMQQYMGATLLGMLATLLLATVLEICSEGTAPMAFEIYRQTGALGNSLVFLMAGVATDYTEIGLLWANIGIRTAVWIPIVTVPQVIIAGLIANWLL